MSFWQYILHSLNNFSLVDAVVILFVFVVLCAVFSYFKKLNGDWFIIVMAIFYMFAFGTMFLGYKLDKTLVFALSLLLWLSGIIIFSSEIRRDLMRMTYKTKHGNSNIKLSHEQVDETISHIVRACFNMSKKDIGALIIVANDEISNSILESGTLINAQISSELMETLFFPKSPLHDGAVLVKGDIILAAGCYLPLSQSNTISKELGTRHRAAIGVTESNPTLTAIVVSEETGIISTVRDGDIRRYLDARTLKTQLSIAYKIIVDETNDEVAISE